MASALGTGIKSGIGKSILASKYFVFVTFSLGDIWVQAVTGISAIMLGLFPLYVTAALFGLLDKYKAGL